MYDIRLFIKCLIDTWIFNSILLLQTILPFSATNCLLHLAGKIHGKGMIKTIGSSSFVLFLSLLLNIESKKVCVNVYMFIYVCVHICRDMHYL